MPLGPIELLVVKFPGNRFRGEIVPALAELVESGTIRIIDIAFAIKGGDGQLTLLELSDLDPDVMGLFDPIVSDVTGLLSEEDERRLASALENNSSAALMLFENTWATRFADAVRNARGEVVVNERIPRVVIDELLAAQASA